jgi:uncharacterized protein YegP (UPF0339 family)
MRVEIHKGEGRHPWYLRLIGANGKTLVTSEGYYSKWNAQRAAKKVFPRLPVKVIE